MIKTETFSLHQCYFLITHLHWQSVLNTYRSFKNKLTGILIFPKEHDHHFQNYRLLFVYFSRNEITRNVLQTVVIVHNAANVEAIKLDWNLLFGRVVYTERGKKIPTNRIVEFYLKMLLVGPDTCTTPIVRESSPVSTRDSAGKSHLPSATDFSIAAIMAKGSSGGGTPKDSKSSSEGEWPNFYFSQSHSE